MTRFTAYDDIAIGGRDTASPLNVAARLRLLSELVPLTGKRVLDCGCGAGGYVTALVALGADAHGIEHDAAKVAAYRRTAREPDRVRAGDLEALAGPARYDVALLNEVLEHVPDELAALRGIRSMLVPDGHLVVLSPNRLYPFETHGITVRATGTQLTPQRTPLVPWIPVALGRRVFDYPARNYWPHELRRLIEAAGFAVARTDYLWQTFENISGTQPAWMRALAPRLRRIAGALGKTPLVRAFGVTQVIVARAPA